MANLASLTVITGRSEGALRSDGKPRECGEGPGSVRELGGVSGSVKVAWSSVAKREGVRGSLGEP